MPMKSEKQRGLFYAALKSKALRKKKGLSAMTVRDMVAHDEPGKLPKRAKK